MLPNTITILSKNYTIILNDGWKFIKSKLADPNVTYVRVDGTGSCLADLFDFLMKIIQACEFRNPATPLVKYIR